MLLLLDDENTVGGTFNVGTSDEISILDLAELIMSRCQSKSSVQLVPYEQAYESGFEDMERRVPDTTKLRTYTGWRPRNSLDDILRDMITDAASELEKNQELVTS